MPISQARAPINPCRFLIVDESSLLYRQLRPTRARRRLRVTVSRGRDAVLRRRGSNVLVRVHSCPRPATLTPAQALPHLEPAHLSVRGRAVTDYQRALPPVPPSRTPKLPPRARYVVVRVAMSRRSHTATLPTPRHAVSTHINSQHCNPADQLSGSAPLPFSNLVICDQPIVASRCRAHIINNKST